MTIITEDQWLSYHGFQQFPFDRPEAGNEGPEFLAACFIEPENFPTILGRADTPTTALLFATRGSGKTACRVMVDYYCHIGNVPTGGGHHTAHVLSVPHTDLYFLLEKADFSKANASKQLIVYHVQEILRRAMPAMTDLLATTPVLYDAANGLSPALKQDLTWLVLPYTNYLSAAQLSFLDQILEGVLLSPDSQESDPSGQKRPLLPQDIFLKAKLESSPLAHLAKLASLMNQIGVLSTYILVDGVDEYMETAADPEKAFQMIRPLLGTLHLMDKTRHLALKFFLPDSIEPFIQIDKSVRSDRGFIFETLHWRDDDLVKILRRRLDALKLEENKNRDRTVTGFDTLCVPELRGQIEADIVHEADGNPRHLIVLAGLMVRAHFNREIKGQDDPFQLNRQDWFIALEQYRIRVTQWKRLSPTTDSELMSLIDQGENDQVEFKASLRWDLRRQTVNKNLEYAIAKTIAAMLNSRGGKLLIGIDDNGQVVGLAHDIQTLNKKNLDGFNLKVGEIIDKHFSAEVAQYISITFESIANQPVCLIKLNKSQRPTYLKVNNQSEFWR